MSESLAHLGKVSRNYAIAAQDYKRICHEAAVAKANFVREKAKFKLQYKADADGKVSDVEAETQADADDTIADLHLKMLTTAALEKSHEKLLIQMKEQQANGRTAVVDERKVDEMHAGNFAGAA